MISVRQPVNIQTPKSTPRPYVDPNFPTWRYHPDGRSTLVVNEVALKNLGDGWFDSPACTDSAPALTSAPIPAISATMTSAPVVGLGAEALKSLHASAAKDVIATISSLPDIQMIKDLADGERLNTKVDGGRPTVLQAADDRIAELTAQ